MGTFAWAAPEMLMGEGLTPAVDVYSLGVVLWEIVTSVRRATHVHLSRSQTCSFAAPSEQLHAEMVPEQLMNLGSRARSVANRCCSVDRNTGGLDQSAQPSAPS